MSNDKNLVEGKIDIIQRNLEFLKGYKNMDEEEFMDSFKDIQAARSAFWSRVASLRDTT